MPMAMRRRNLFDEDEPERSPDTPAGSQELLGRISGMLGPGDGWSGDLSECEELKPDLLRVFCEMLDGEGYGYDRIAPDAVRMTMALEAGTIDILINTFRKLDYIGVVARYAPRVEWEMRPAVAEAIITLNNTAFIGHFEMDPHNGELRFRISRDTEHTGFTVDEARAMLNFACMTVSSHYTTLMKIAYGAMTPGDLT
jgi:hypothetical protein